MFILFSQDNFVRQVALISKPGDLQESFHNAKKKGNCGLHLHMTGGFNSSMERPTKLAHQEHALRIFRVDGKAFEEFSP